MKQAIYESNFMLKRSKERSTVTRCWDTRLSHWTQTFQKWECAVGQFHHHSSHNTDHCLNIQQHQTDWLSHNKPQVVHLHFVNIIRLLIPPGLVQMNSYSTWVLHYYLYAWFVINSLCRQWAQVLTMPSYNEDCLA